ncbi:MAG: hypothetical protein EA397_11545 [Deltaproteobacteria bacterium]|nr:MAG: hypothetical protein EA397_11545 [Deltaproteobacteria bacterium]
MIVVLLSLLLGLPALAADPGDELFAQRRLASERFPDSDEEGPTFGPGDKLHVLAVEGDRMRVIGPDDRIGWVEADGAVQLFELPDDLRSRVLEGLFGGGGAPAGLPVGR